MLLHPLRHLTFGALLLAAAGCTKTPDQPATTTPKAVATVDSTATRPLCENDWLWSHCVLMDHLVHAGLAPTADSTDTTRVAYLKPPGLHYRIGKRSQLITFIYPDSATALKAWKELDTLRLVPRADTIVPWGGPPTPIRAGNLIAVLVSDNPVQIERVQNMFAGGLPAPRK